MRNLSSVSWRSFRRSVGRFVLTATGIALGVAILFGVLVANASSTAALDRQFWALDEPIVVVRPFGGEGGALSASDGDLAARLDGVRSASANLGFMVEVVKPPATAPPGEPYVMWMATTKMLKEDPNPPRPDDGEPQRTWKLEGREPAAGADEIALTTTRAKALGLKLGDSLELKTPDGPRSFILVGLDRLVPGPTPEGGVWTSMETAGGIFGQGDVWREVWLRLEPGTDVGKWVARHRTEVPTTIRLVPAAAGQTETRTLVDVVHLAFTSIAAIALFAAAFLIYLTLSMAVVERTRLYGTLRAVGARSSQVMRIVMGEAAVMGVLATVAGLVLGLGVAALLLKLTAGLYDIGEMRIRVPLPALGASALLGVVTTLVAAYLPARRASGVTPVAAIRGTPFEEGRLSRGWMIGIVASVIGFATPFLPSRRGLDVGVLLVMLGAVLLVPPVVRPVARLVGRGTRRLARGVGDVGVMHLVKQRSRSAYTLALVMVMLAAVFAIGSANMSVRGTLDRDIEQRFGSDFAVWGEPRVSADVQDQVGALDGVQAMTPVRFAGTTTTDQRPVELVIVEPASYFAQQSFAWVRGDDARVQAAMDKGGAIVASEAMLYELGLDFGDWVTLNTLEGDRRFRIVGTYASIELENRAAIGLVDGERYFRVGEPNGLFVKVDDGRAVAPVLEAARAAFASRTGVSVQPMSEQAEAIRSDIDRYFAVFFAIVLVAGVVGLLGLANTLAMSVVQRTREIGVLRSVGTQRRQVAGMIVVESATLSVVAFILAIPLGLMLSFALLKTSASALGLIIHYAYPWPMVFVVGILAVIVALAAAVAPGRRASRVDPVVALRFE